MHTIFEDENTEAAPLVDAANAFNSGNRKMFFNNIFITCPAIATITHVSEILQSYQKVQHRETPLLCQFMQLHTFMQSYL